VYGLAVAPCDMADERSSAALLTFATLQATRRRVPADCLPLALPPAAAGGHPPETDTELKALEWLTRTADLYVWLAIRDPGCYFQRARVEALRSDVGALIEAGLERLAEGGGERSPRRARAGGGGRRRT